MNTSPLADLIDDIQSGFACGESVDDGIVQLRMNNVNTEGLIDFATVRRVPLDATKDVRRFSLTKGDVMFNNTNSPELVGKSAVFRGFHEPVVFSNHFTRIRVRLDRLEPRFLARWLVAEWKAGRFSRMCNQWVNQASVRKDALLILKVPTPALAEQRSIADILDKADAIRRKRKEAIALTEQLLRSAFLEMFGDPVTNPMMWPVKALGEVFDRLEAGWSANGDARPRAENEYGVLKISAVTSGIFRPDEHKAISASAIDRELITPRRGDLLFSRANTRELVAATCLVERNEPRLFLPDKLWRVVPRIDAVTTPYLRFLLAHDRFRSELTKTATGTSGSMLNVSMEKLRGVRGPFPPIDQQKKFAALVWRSLGAKAKHEAAYETTQTLFSALVSRAFPASLEDRC